MASTHAVRSLLLATSLLATVAACTNGSEPQSQSPASARSQAAAPTTSPLRLNEIGIVPTPDAPAFIELINTGEQPVSLAGVTVRIDAGATVNLPQALTLAPGAWLVVVFDDQSGIDVGVVHAPAADFAGGESGALQLAVPGGAADAVAWGRPDIAAVNLCRGGRCTTPAAGSVVARVPGLQAAFTPSAWAPLDAVLATPGNANPRPPVAAFAAVPNMMFAGAPRFSWYSVPGAARYRLQVARGDTFDEIVHEAEIEATAGVRLEQLTATGPQLPPGSYTWRVEAVGAAGEAAEFSAAVPFSVDPSRSAAPPAPPAGRAPPSRVPEGLLKVLDVPIIKHAKDTRMLALEASREDPLWSWDTPDFAGYPYCARAGVAMVNAFYGGDLSQDRIAYEVYKDLHEGPEYDLPIVGISDPRTHEYALPLALGTSGQYISNTNDRDFDQPQACMDYIEAEALAACASQCPVVETEECFQCRLAREDEIGCPVDIAYRFGFDLIEDIQREIDAGRPIIATTPSHLFLIVGYRLQDGDFSYFYQDAGGRVENEADAADLTRRLDGYWIGLAPVAVGTDEPEVGSDTDGDGVVDFDEMFRFGTDVMNADSDADGVRDKDEIRASVWDPQHGYHRSVQVLEPTAWPDYAAAAANVSGRDFDRDGLAMELDFDSDGGGCRDGAEDENFNGLLEASETYNFDGADDDCELTLGGRIEMSYWFVPGRPPACKGSVDIRLRFDLEPDWGGVPEASRTAIPVVYQARRAQYEISTAGCEDIVGGLFDFFGDANVACNLPADRQSGTIALGPESNSGVTFFPLDPQLHVNLPRETRLDLRGQCVYGDGTAADLQLESVGSEVVRINSGPDCETSERYDPGQGPDLLAFCVPPTACNVGPDAPLTDCYTQPQRYAEIPFSGSASKLGALLEGHDLNGNPFPIPVDDAHVRWEVCDGCGDRFLQ